MNSKHTRNVFICKNSSPLFKLSQAILPAVVGSGGDEDVAGVGVGITEVGCPIGDTV